MNILNNTLDQIEENEFEFSKYAAKELRDNAVWATTLLEKPQIIEALSSINLSKNSSSYFTNQKNLLFKIRFAYLLHLTNVSVKYNYLTAYNNSAIDFKIISNPKVLIKLVSITSSSDLKEPIKSNYISPLRLSIPLSEMDLINMINMINDNILYQKNKSNNNIYMVILDVRRLNRGLTNSMQYYDFLYGKDPILENLFGVTPSSFNCQYLEKGVFSTDNAITKLIQAHIHAIGVINEKTYDNKGLLASLDIFHNPKFFNNSNKFRTSLPGKLANFVPDVTVF